MKRELGYYWVKRVGIWEIARYYPKHDKWYMCGADFDIDESTFEEIDETPLTRI